MDDKSAISISTLRFNRCFYFRQYHSMDSANTKRQKEMISGHSHPQTGAVGFVCSIVKSIRPTPIEHHSAASPRHFLKCNIIAVLLLSVFSTQFVWAFSGDREIRSEQNSSTATVVSESGDARVEASANPSIKISIQEDLISLDARDADLREVLDALSRVSGIPITSIDLDKTAPITITTSFKDLSIESAVKIVIAELAAGGIALVSADEGDKPSKSIKHVYVLTKAGTYVPPLNLKGLKQKETTEPIKKDYQKFEVTKETVKFFDENGNVKKTIELLETIPGKSWSEVVKS